MTHLLLEDDVVICQLLEHNHHRSLKIKIIKIKRIIIIKLGWGKTINLKDFHDLKFGQRRYLRQSVICAVLYFL